MEALPLTFSTAIRLRRGSVEAHCSCLKGEEGFFRGADIGDEVPEGGRREPSLDHVVDEVKERGPVAVPGNEGHRLSMEGELGPGERLHGFLQCAYAAWQHDEGVGLLEQDLLAFMHGVHDAVFDRREDPFDGLEKARHHAENTAACLMGRARCRPHQADMPTSIHQSPAPSCDRLARRPGEGDVGWVYIVGRAAINGDGRDPGHFVTRTALSVFNMVLFSDFGKGRSGDRTGTGVETPSMSPHSDAVRTDVDALEVRKAGLGLSLARIGLILARPELKAWRPMMVLSLLLTLAGKLLAVAAPVYFGQAVNQLGAGEAALTSVAIAIGLWSAARFLSACLPYARDAIFAPISQAAQRVVAVDAFGKAQSLSLQFHQTRRTGALNRVIERGSGALDTLIRFLAFSIGPTLIELALASAVLATIYGGWSALAAVSTVVLYGVFTFFITNKRVIQQRRLNEADTELRARAVDSLNNFETVKAFAAEARETGRFDQALAAYNVRMVETSRSLAFLNAGQELIMNLGLTAVAALTAWAALGGEGEARPGDLAAVTLIMMNLYRPLNILGWAFREIKQGAVDLEKLFGLMGMVPEVADKPGAPAFVPGGGRIEFDAVTFAHEARAGGLDQVSFIARPGTRIAIVGPSGAGKSTLLKLLFRFYDVQGGAIRIDGQDVREVTQSSLREAVGLVPQDVTLFNTTLLENLIYGRPEATEAEVREAVRKARLSEFVAALPQGWDTRVGERGVKLSGGERQRVGIARAILRNPAILVLDEATSALDSATEAEVQLALDEASRGRTTLLVAHRLSTVAGADMIVVLDEGRVIEAGAHDELLARGGLYADLWRRQARMQVLEPEAAVLSA